MALPPPWFLTGCFIPLGEKGRGYAQAASKDGVSVLPETLVIVQTGAHGELTHHRVPPLVSSPVDSDHVLFCSNPGSDSAQGSDVSLMDPKV